MNILVLNSGSSSQKVSLYEIGDALPENPPVPVWEGRIEWNGNTAAITVRNSRGIARKQKLNSRSSEWVLKDLLGTLWSGEMPSIGSAADIDAVGHRVVHGGEPGIGRDLLGYQREAGLFPGETRRTVRDRRRPGQDDRSGRDTSAQEQVG